jgi:hypothetical protein
MENATKTVQKTQQPTAELPVAVNPQQLALANAGQVQARPVSLSQRLNMHYQRLVTNPGDYVLTALTSMATFMAVRYAALSLLTLGPITAPIATPLIAGMMAAGLIAMFHATAQEKAKRNERMAMIENDPSLQLTPQELDRAQQLNGVAIISSGLRHAAFSGLFGSLLGYLFTEAFPDLFDKANHGLTPNEPNAPELPNLDDTGLADGESFVFGDDVTRNFGDHVTVQAGNGATFTAGDHGSFTLGDHATLEAGDGVTIEAGVEAKLKVGDHATLTVGDNATILAGDNATLTIGENCTYEVGENATIFDLQGNLLEGEAPEQMAEPDNSTTTDTQSPANHRADTPNGKNYSSSPDGGLAGDTNFNQSQVINHQSENLATDNTPLPGAEFALGENLYDPTYFANGSEDLTQDNTPMPANEFELGENLYDPESVNYDNDAYDYTNDPSTDGIEWELQDPTTDNSSQAPGELDSQPYFDDNSELEEQGVDRANQANVADGISDNPDAIEYQEDQLFLSGGEIAELPKQDYSVEYHAPEQDLEQYLPQSTKATQATPSMDAFLNKEMNWTAELAEARLENQLEAAQNTEMPKLSHETKLTAQSAPSFSVQDIINAQSTAQAAGSFTEQLSANPPIKLAATPAQQAANFIDRIEKMAQETPSLGRSN